MTVVGLELRRKALHVAMGGFALLLRWLTPVQAALCAVAALLFNLLLLQRVTRRRLLRASEREGGFSWGMALYPAAVLATILVFHRRLELAAAVWALLAFGDGMATVAGVTLGGPRLPWNRDKSWAGLAAFVVWGTATAAFLLRWVQHGALDGQSSGAVSASFLATHGAGSTLSDTSLLLGGCLAAALAAGLAESARTGIDDNVLVPLVGGVTLAAAALVDPDRIADAGPAIGRGLLVGLAINAALALGAWFARGVTLSGALWGVVLGTLLYGFAGWRGFLLLFAFFVLGTAATRLGYARKASLGIAQEKGGRRSGRHAFANAGAGVIFAFLALSTPQTAVFSVALVAAFATAAADTVSSEIGQAYGRTPYLVTTFRRVPPGTDGAVSVEGTLAGIAASLLLAVLAWAVGLPGMGVAGIVIVVAAAFAGTTIESYLGATLERRARIDNELINFANTIAGGVVALALALLAG